MQMVAERDFQRHMPADFEPAQQDRPWEDAGTEMSPSALLSCLDLSQSLAIAQSLLSEGHVSQSSSMLDSIWEKYFMDRDENSPQLQREWASYCALRGLELLRSKGSAWTAAIHHFTKALLAGPEEDLRMHSHLGRAVARIEQVRRQPSLLNGCVEDIADDLQAAEAIAETLGKATGAEPGIQDPWTVRVAVSNLRGQLAAGEDPEKADSYFSRALNIADENAHKEDPACSLRRKVKIHQDAIDAFLRNGEVNYVKLYADKVLVNGGSLPGNIRSMIRSFTDALELLKKADALRAEFVIGCAFRFADFDADIAQEILWSNRDSPMDDAGRRVHDILMNVMQNSRKLPGERAEEMFRELRLFVPRLGFPTAGDPRLN